MTLDEFHTDKSRIVLNNDGAVITMFFYSISFDMGFNTYETILSRKNIVT